MSWAEVKKINSDMSTQLDHLFWLDYARTYGTSELTDAKLQTLYTDCALSMNTEFLRQDAFDWIYENQPETMNRVFSAFSEFDGTDISEDTTMYLIGADETAYNIIVASSTIYGMITNNNSAFIEFLQGHYGTTEDLIWGVTWSGGSETTWTRTDLAADFEEPEPAISNGDGSSPFDDIYPWNAMERVEDDDGGVMVKIPKYYYKWTSDGTALSLQISLTELDGFYVSPAHADRGDGSGERDVVYVGAYHSTSTYKSTSGSTPLASITRATARTNIASLGSGIYQYDFAMYWTIAMLYLVEYADWDSQTVIGYGCSSSSAVASVGQCDGMTYHTGTSASSRTTYGYTRYRYIEGLWDNVFDWCDGIYFSSANIYCISNPSNFSDTSNGTLIGTRPTSSGYISAWTVPSTSGFEYALYPSAVGGSTTTYCPDYCYYGSSGVVLYVGGYYGQSLNYGLFYLRGDGTASHSHASIGCRIQKLP